MIDISRYMGAVTREVGSREYEGKPVRVVLVTRTYETTLQDTWDCLTNPERIPKWFLPITGELRLGGRFQLSGNASGEIIVCQPPSQLTVTWESATTTSWVAVRLTRLEDDLTRLSLEHMSPLDDPIWERYGPGAVGVGWDMFFMGLARYLDTNLSANPEEAAKWLGSDDGKHFVLQSSQDWERAAVASGVAEDLAKAAAQLTYAFYTGAAQQPEAK